MERDEVAFGQRYFQALGTRKPEDLQCACKLAHEIRKFEIELYWKRAAYFWAFQLIAFTALGFALKDGELKSLPMLIISGSMGVITAYAGYLTALGSKFWQENWESHVDMLETEMRLRLTQTVLCRERPHFSVSRVNQFLLRQLTLGWGIVLLTGVGALAAPSISYLPQLPKMLLPVCGVGILLAVTAICIRMKSTNRSHFSGRAFRLGDSDWTIYKSGDKEILPSIIWRDPLSNKLLRTECSEDGKSESGTTDKIGTVPQT